MKLLHIADLHIGKQIYGFSLLEDQRFALQNILNLAKQHQVQALLLAGDLYDKSVPSAEATALLDQFLTQAAAQGLHVFAIPGNHDSVERIAYAQQLLEQSGVHVAPVFAGQMTHHVLTDEYGPVNIWLLPFLKPAHVRKWLDEEAASRIETYTDALRAVVENANIPAGQRNVILSHQFVVGCSGETPEQCESELSIGGLDSVNASVYDPFDYVALGHIHGPQRVGRDTIRYAGSPLKYSFSERFHNKSATLITLGPAGETPQLEPLPITPLHDVREVRGPLAELLAPETVAQGNPNDYIHMVLTDEVPIMNAMGQARQAYPNLMALDYDNASTRHAGSASQATLEEVQQLNTAELFAQFFEEQHGHGMTREQQARVIDLLETLGEGGAA